MESLYRALETYNSLDLVQSSDDCACAIFLLSGLKELGRDIDSIASAFDADPARVRVLLTTVASDKYGEKKETQNNGSDEKEEKTNEID